MICKLCGKDTVSKQPVKDGAICPECYNNLPRSFKDSAKKITVKQIAAAKRVIKKCYSKAWATCESIKICNNSIQIDNWEIELKNLSKVSLNFHPENNGAETGYAYGMVTVVLETKEPQMRIEEPFICTEIRYYITGKEISYSYPNNIQSMFVKVQRVIDDGSFDTTCFKPHRQVSGGSSPDTQSRQQMTEFERAKTLYDVEIPFTKTDLNKKKRELSKSCHPDNGGSLSQIREVNAAYELLLKFAD